MIGKIIGKTLAKAGAELVKAPVELFEGFVDGAAEAIDPPPKKKPKK